MRSFVASSVLQVSSLRCRVKTIASRVMTTFLRKVISTSVLITSKFSTPYRKKTTLDFYSEIAIPGLNVSVIFFKQIFLQRP